MTIAELYNYFKEIGMEDAYLTVCYSEVNGKTTEREVMPPMIGSDGETIKIYLN